jgi:hypothetical protein
MAKHAEYIIKGIDDFELGIARQTPLKYFLTLPDDDKIKGLCFFIPGLGDENNEEYIIKFRSFVADNYSMGCVSVSYHAINARHTRNAKIDFEYEDIERLNDFLKYFGCPLTYKSFDEAISILDQTIEKHGNRFICLTGHLNFGDQTEYQNFGVMQALDHICVLYDLQNRINLDWKGNIIAFGSSHGGYIANLLSKFAPNSITAVFDNSSYADPPLYYVMERELKHGCSFIPAERLLKNIGIYLSIKSGWTTNSLASNYYSEDARRIRSFLYEQDIIKMAEIGNNKTQYRFYHSKYDYWISNVYEKIAMVTLLKKHNFDTKIYVMDHKDIDGKFVKNLDHGMNLSLQQMFSNLYSDITFTNSYSDITLKSLVRYESLNGAYEFKYESDKIIPKFVRYQMK